ncbi:MAG TPA: lytic transglycosylase domain-containing protein [Terriglobia bacterium]|nr:lytic transglycosylase domain-containing protein [Terriglobia bacterium]
MSETNKLHRVSFAWLACGLAVGGALFAPRPARAAPGDHLAAVRDQQGRIVYVNAFPSPPSSRAGARSFLGLIQQASERLQLDPGLLHAVIRVESDYNPRAVSSKGAMGLMQLIPSTAQRFGVHDPFDPRQNIEGGASYLRYLLQLFSGDVPRSLAAYNAGEHSVLRSVARDGGLPRIPETRDYVRKVTAAYNQVSGVRDQDSGTANRSVQPRISDPEPRIYSYVDSQGVVHFEQ